jgi:hypothetical protein
MLFRVLVVIGQSSPAYGLVWESSAPVISAAVAVVALLVALSNRQIAKRALGLSERQEERRNARLELSLDDAVSWRPVGEVWRWIGIHLLAVNPTDRSGSLVGAELHVTYTTRNGAAGIVVKIPHETTVVPRGGMAPIHIPADLPANGAVRGWLLFRLHDEVVGPGAIQRFDAVVRDSRGPVVAIQAGILREIRDDQAP